jgi:hypothetical protein
LTPTVVVAPTHTSTTTSPISPPADTTSTPTPGGGAVVATATWTQSPELATPTTAAGPGASGSLRGYLCPLSVLLAFAIGVLILSIVMPRIQERRQGMGSFQHAASAYGVVARDGSDGEGASRVPAATEESALPDALLAKEPAPEPGESQQVEGTPGAAGE